MSTEGPVSLKLVVQVKSKMKEENQNDVIKQSSENNAADDKPVETTSRQQDHTLTPEQNSQLAPGNHLFIICTSSAQDIACLFDIVKRAERDIKNLIFR